MKNNFFSGSDSRRLNLGGYSVAAAVLVLAIAVAINLLVGALPSGYTKLDNTPSGIFTLSQETEKLLSNLDEDIHIYWIVQSGQEDSSLENLLERYCSLSDRISLSKKDPDVYPGFAMNYTSGQVYNNSLVVESQKRYRYVNYSELYEYDYSDYYTDYSYDVYFAGEGALTSAIDYVTCEEMPKLYVLTGHGENQLSSGYQSAVERANVEIQELSLLSLEAVPEDADLVLVCQPQRDISESERQKLSDYLLSGGNMLLITDPPLEDKHTNLEELMAGYGIEAVEGVVVEGSQDNYAWGAPYYLLPDIAYHTITEPLTDEGYYVLLPIAQGLKVSDELPEGVSVTQILTTSDAAYSKMAGYNLTTYEREEGDADGPFALGVAITHSIDKNTESHIVWVSSGGLLDEQSNAQVSGGNQDLFLNAISWMAEREEGIAIHAKILSTEYLTIPSSEASVMAAVMIGLLPACCLGIGLYVWLRRKRR